MKSVVPGAPQAASGEGCEPRTRLTPDQSVPGPGLRRLEDQLVRNPELASCQLVTICANGHSSCTKIAVMTPLASNRQKRAFDSNTFLATIGEGRKIMRFEKKEEIFTQGENADAVFYIQSGRVKLSVASKSGKEATISILGKGSFVGEAALAGHSRRMASASALTDSELMRLDKKAMMRVLHREHAFSENVRGSFADQEHSF